MKKSATKKAKTMRVRRTKAGSTDSPAAGKARESRDDVVSLYALACSKTALRACWLQEKRLMTACSGSETEWPYGPAHMDNMRILRECCIVLDEIAQRIQAEGGDDSLDEKH